MTETTAAALAAATDARWEALRAYLTAERDALYKEALQWKAGSETQARFYAKARTAGEALAKMTELEAEQ